MQLDQINARLAPHFLEVLGGFAPVAGEAGLAARTRTLVLIGPREPGYWPHLTRQAEWLDGAADPVDRWSRRVLGRLACDLGGKAYFPFGGPPYHPFFAWALRSGQIWQSPVRLLVHAHQGLMVSFRGALALPFEVALPQLACVCDGCSAPCLTACPAGAVGREGYDVPRCHEYLDQSAGGSCLNQGCQLRRACPVSLGYARMEVHSAYHMRQFHP